MNREWPGFLKVAFMIMTIACALLIIAYSASIGDNKSFEIKQLRIQIEQLQQTNAYLQSTIDRLLQR